MALGVPVTVGEVLVLALPLDGRAVTVCEYRRAMSKRSRWSSVAVRRWARTIRYERCLLRSITVDSRRGLRREQRVIIPNPDVAQEIRRPVVQDLFDRDLRHVLIVRVIPIHVRCSDIARIVTEAEFHATMTCHPEEPVDRPVNLLKVSSSWSETHRLPYVRINHVRPNIEPLGKLDMMIELIRSRFPVPGIVLHHEAFQVEGEDRRCAGNLEALGSHRFRFATATDQLTLIPDRDPDRRNALLTSVLVVTLQMIFPHETLQHFQ